MKINPVFDLEIKTKLRRKKFTTLITIYLTVLSVAVILYLLARHYGHIYDFPPRIIMELYIILAIFQLGSLLFIVPGLTSSLISTEVDRQTLDLLLCSKISCIQIITGKIHAGLSRVILLVISSIPIFFIVLLYGGISLLDIIIMILFQLSTVLVTGSIGIFFSTLLKKTTAATVATYSLVILFTLGTFICFPIYNHINSIFFDRTPYLVESIIAYTPNSFTGLFSILYSQTGEFRGLINNLYNINRDGSIKMYVNLPWITNLIFNFVLSYILIVISSKILNPLKKGIKG